MRIISGRFKGKVIHAPKNLPVRPTTDQAKEGLFNILRNWYDFEDLKVLELFAGTGNMSYEFASRGVAHVTAVDRHYGCVKFIQEQFRGMGIVGEVKKSDAGKFLSRASQQWDIIFMDPPYGMPGLDQLVRQALERKLLGKQGVLILEHPSQESYTTVPGFAEERKYGSSVFSIFEELV